MSQTSDLRKEETRRDVFERLSEILVEYKKEIPRAKKDFRRYVEGYEEAVEHVRTGFPRDGYLEEFRRPNSRDSQAGGWVCWIFNKFWKPRAASPSTAKGEREMSAWISVKDRLPNCAGLQDGGTDRVLVKINAHYAPSILIASGEYWEEGFTWTFDGRPYDKDRSEVTHWVPLPDPPAPRSTGETPLSDRQPEGETKCPIE